MSAKLSQHFSQHLICIWLSASGPNQIGTVLYYLTDNRTLEQSFIPFDSHRELIHKICINKKDVTENLQTSYPPKRQILLDWNSIDLNTPTPSPPDELQKQKKIPSLTRFFFACAPDSSFFSAKETIFVILEVVSFSAQKLFASPESQLSFAQDVATTKRFKRGLQNHLQKLLRMRFKEQNTTLHSLCVDNPCASDDCDAPPSLLKIRKRQHLKSAQRLLSRQKWRGLRWISDSY